MFVSMALEVNDALDNDVLLKRHKHKAVESEGILQSVIKRKQVLFCRQDQVSSARAYLFF